MANSDTPAEPYPRWRHQVRYPRWRHKVRGSTYAEIARATVSTNGPDEGKRVVVYRSTSHPHEVFVRDEKEFEDGRFERL